MQKTTDRSRARALVARALPAVAALACAACSTPKLDQLPEDTVDLSPLGGDRPVDPYVPSVYKPGTPVPLVILLHGYGAAGALEELIFRLKPVSEAYGFLYLAPDGTVDKDDKRFWNATDACCDFGGTGVDDVAYLRGLIDEAKKRFSVDPKRVFVTGHSNGGFMSYRMACDASDVVAAVASLAGATWSDPSKCKPTEKVSTLEIHGTADDEVPYEGDPGMPGFPGAEATTQEWASRGGCDAAADTTAPPLDLSSKFDGAETAITRYNGCDPGGGAELWTMQGEGHIPATNDAFGPAVIDYLFAHPKP